MKVVWKFPLTDELLVGGSLKTVASFTVMMPRGAIILHFAMQHDLPTIWALVDSENDNEAHSFKVVGTGKEITFDTDEYIFVGTAMTFNHNTVVHLFEKMTA